MSTSSIYPELRYIHILAISIFGILDVRPCCTTCFWTSSRSHCNNASYKKQSANTAWGLPRMTVTLAMQKLSADVFEVYTHVWCKLRTCLRRVRRYFCHHVCNEHYVFCASGAWAAEQRARCHTSASHRIHYCANLNCIQLTSRFKSLTTAVDFGFSPEPTANRPCLTECEPCIAGQRHERTRRLPGLAHQPVRTVQGVRLGECSQHSGLQASEGNFGRLTAARAYNILTRPETWRQPCFQSCIVLSRCLIIEKFRIGGSNALRMRSATPQAVWGLKAAGPAILKAPK